ncbi:response regulator [Neptuniibacter halophilus]|uniref:response regulator n=1 Tax=Neptuniibacter halophilus TaxID=651666 RepID=UPI002572BCE1|nr:response regulator [Neptuniibacter halophilus]
MSRPVPVVICDDSRLARKQMASALRGWNVEVTFAEHGLEGLEAVRAGKGEILFLDLTMPIMDGYQVLERIRRDDLPAMTIVVSADVQPEARKRVLQLGALEFIKKPTTPESITEVLQQFGLLSELEHPSDTSDSPDNLIALPEYYQEVSNVAMGQAGEMLARLLNTFIHLPIPAVTMTEAVDINAQLIQVRQSDCDLISQGFIGGGVAGEALLILPKGNLAKVSRLMPAYDSGEFRRSELMMSLANALIAAFLSSFSQQLDLVFSKGTPFIVHDYNGMNDRIEKFASTLTISIDYRLSEHDFECELLLVFTPDSLPRLQKIASYF